MKDPAANGFWAVEFVRAGTYRVTLRGRPAGIAHRLAAGTACLRIGDSERSAPVAAGAHAVTFSLDVPAGPVLLQTWLDESSGPSRGAYFVDVECVE